MEKAKLKICLAHFIHKHFDKKEFEQNDLNSGPHNNETSKEWLTYDLEHLINQLKDILVLMKGESHSCKDEDSYNDRLRQTLNSFNSDQDEKSAKNGGVNIVTVSSIEFIPQPDPTIVQVRASKAEMDRRIAAFIEKKRMEVNEDNRREFSVTNTLPISTSCARTDAVFNKRPDSKGHVKVSKVFNSCGPEVEHKGRDEFTANVKSEPLDSINIGMQERIRNMEEHLQIKLGSKKDIADRIRSLEERILYLESLSPEYFTQNNMPRLNKNTDQEMHFSSKTTSIAELDERIHFLTQSLKRKASSVIKCESI